MPFYYLDYGDYLGGGKGKKNFQNLYLKLYFSSNGKKVSSWP